jgi:hypothetical protein
MLLKILNEPTFWSQFSLLLALSDTCIPHIPPVPGIYPSLTRIDSEYLLQATPPPCN